MNKPTCTGATLQEVLNNQEIIIQCLGEFIVVAILLLILILVFK